MDETEGCGDAEFGSWGGFRADSILLRRLLTVDFAI
jgi:hypothetical protein